jgi:hypothetical protein
LLAFPLGGLIRIFLAAVALAFAMPRLSVAQDTSEKADGIICLVPECDLRTSLPRSVSGPLEAESFLVERVRNTPTSVLHSGLPPITFEAWLFSTLQRHLARAHEPFADWSLSFCDEPKSAVPRAGPDLCIHVKVPIVGERLVNVHVGVATGRTSVAGETVWKEIVPTVRDIYVERLDPERVLEQHAVDSLDVETLANLESDIRQPFDQWPTVDFKSTVSWARETPQPDTLVRIRISVENKGRRNADRAAVSVLVSIPQENGEHKEIRREWFPRIPAGTSASLELFARLSRGDAMIIVSTNTTHGFKRIRETNPGDNDTVGHIELPR